ncbi:MAG TPA: 3TM-type holin, partial [Salinarimonas sp.]|nr:3TM-type holin [Salinarimonas sp.]
MLPALMAVLGPILGKAAERLIPDPEARAKWVSETLGMFMQADLGQLKVNEAEAQSSSIFVAGWRPFIGWVCGAALLYSYLLVPLVVWLGFVIGKPV